MKKVYLLLVLCLISIAGYAQTAASYAFTRTTGTYTSIVGGSGTVTISSGGCINDDGTTTGIPIGFTFVFCGTSYTSLSACSNGWISLANSSLVTYPASQGGIGSAGWIMGLWNDGYGSASTAYYQTSGSAGSRVFTFQYLNWNICCGTGYNMNWQVKLFEGTNVAQICYGTYTTSATNYGIGIANSTSDFQVLPSTASTTCSTTFTAVNSQPANGSILQWSPCSPSAVGGNTGPVCQGSTLTLTNSLSGGAWTSASTGVATVVSGTGVVTGVSAGTAVISYTAACGSTVTTTVTVLAAPAAITGNAPFPNCTNITLADPSGAGTWSSGSPSIATVVSGTGVVTGVTAGSGTITFTLASTGCMAIAPVTVTALPASTGGNQVCVGSTMTLANSVTGGSWSSSNTGLATVGTGTGLVTGVGAGSLNIVYTMPGACTSTLPITVNPLPAAIGGTSPVCAGSNITLTDATGGGTWSSSNTALATVAGGVVTGVAGGTLNISYTLPTGCFAIKSVTVNADAPITGGSSVCFGNPMTLGNATAGGGTWSSSNTAVATINSSTGSVTTVSLGSTTISFTATTGCVTTSLLNVTNPPVAYTVIGGGAYCAGGAGLTVGLNTTGSGTTYSLWLGATHILPDISTGGTAGLAINFPAQTAAGTYYIIANYGTPCATTMNGSATITINPLPTAFAVTGGGNFCVGGSGIAVGLASSTIGVNYQLYLAGAPVGATFVGTGGAINFGLQTAVGNYTVVATNATTFCTNNMTGFVTVGTNPLPTAYSVTGTGSYCAGGSGVPVGLSSSTLGTTYQLYLGGTPIGSSVLGTGSAITFGNQTATGTYTVVGTITSTGCSATMSGSAVININTLPTAYNVTGGGSYCAGGTGVAIGLNGSQTGVNYQLMNGTSPVGSPVAGAGTSISFGFQTAVGSYNVVATNATTFCTSNMTGSVAVTTTPLPTISSVTGGGGYCAGGTGVVVGLSGSNTGVNYQLYNGTTIVGGASGTGAALNFGLQTAAGTYTIVATNPTTFCTANMSGSVNVVINPLPAVFTVTNALPATYCTDATGVLVGLSGSASGVNYQLYNGTVPGTILAGTGAALNFGAQLAGSYSVVAINASTTCTNNMAGTAFITANPLPTVYTLTGGGGYCSGGSGVAIGLSSSNTGISYQLYNTSGAAGLPVLGTGTTISFGLQTTASLRDSVVATNTVTGCTSIMSGNVPVNINALPTTYSVSVSSPGSYCAGGTGLTINLGGSAAGTTYQAFVGGVSTGAPLTGTGAPLVFGPFTTAGTYTIVATTSATGCTNNMAGSGTIVINPLPAVFSVTGGGAYCSGTGGMHIGLSASVTGINYQLYNGVLPVAGALVPGNGLPLDFGSITTAGTYSVVAITPGTLCQSNMSGSVNISINPLPVAYTVTQSATSYCAGGTGVHIGLSNSAVGFTYQLMLLGGSVGGPVSGIGAPIDFGIQTASGAYTVIATNSTTGCSATMTGTATVAINILPTLHHVNGGSNICPGASSMPVGLDGSNLGISYQLYNGSTPVGAAVPGLAGLPISFGPQTTAGTYTVVATNTTSSCSINMLGSTTISINPVPLVFNVNGGGNYCIGGTGINVGLTGSENGVNYQLLDGSAPMGAPQAGSTMAISFGLQTITGTYTVVATNAITGCTSTMFGSAIVGTNPLPALHNVTGGGNYCSGTSGSSIGLDGSDAGISYHLFFGPLPVGSSIAGTGSAIDFGVQTGIGSYTVIATNTTTSCNHVMTGTANINVNPLPASYTVTGGGNYCAGTAGVPVGLISSDPAASYQLYQGITPIGSLAAGTGSSLGFGMVTATGIYSVKAIDNVTGCSKMMTNTVNVGISALPTPFIVSGGGNYCSGGTGVHILLSGSNPGVNYQLWDGGVIMGFAMAGTGMGLDFGPQTGAGIYTIVGSNPSTTCTNNMLGSATVNINPLPSVHALLSTSSSYCAGGTGVEITLAGSDAGVNYMLYNGIGGVGTPIAGTGSAISFGFVTGTGTYTSIATDASTGCTMNMAPAISVTISSLPNVYAITGGGPYCNGGSGVHIGLSNSNSGISYQLYNGALPVGAAVFGTGAALDFGWQTAAGTYTVIATNTTTSCTSLMSGTATVIVNALPAGYTVTGGGNYCAGGAGSVISLSGSAIGITYQLVNGTTLVGGTVTSGTGSGISFGMQSATGVYTVKATSSVTGCSSTMTGSATVGINSLPVAYGVTGGGNYCPGGSGLPVNISGSNSGITYQLFNGSASVGAGIGGVTGSPISFGLQTAPGNYTVVASDNATGCINNMTGTVTIGLNALPAVHSVVGGGNYCAGGSGVHIGLSTSDAGVNYTLFNTSGVITLPGTGGPLDFGPQTTAGAYTVQAVNATTGCSSNMSGTVTVVVNPVITPLVSISTSAGSDTSCSGDYTTFSAFAVNGGTAPSYQWTVNGVVAGTGSTYGYIPANGDVIAVTLNSNATCAIPSSAGNSISMVVDTKQLPVVSVATDPGTEVCQGTAVTFTATSSYGGTAPVYSWVKNGTSLGSSSTFTCTPSDNDNIYCILSSNYHCRLANTASSNHVNMKVDAPVLPVVTITAEPGVNLSAGETVTLVANILNGGPTPSIQWLINGVPVPGAISASFVNNTFADLDSITCQVLSSGGCSGLLGFNSITLHIANVGVKPVTMTGSSIALVPNPNKGNFTLKGIVGSSANEEMFVEVVNMLGQVVYNQKVTVHNGELNEHIQLGNSLANGMYILNLKSATENTVFHFVVEQ